MKKGFTLTELLAVIVIISVLIIITIPVYNKISSDIKESNLENTKEMVANTMLNYANKYLIDVIKPAANKCSTASSCCKYYSINYIKNNHIFETSNGKITNAVTNSELTGYVKVYYNVETLSLEAVYSASIPSSCGNGE